MLKNCKSLTAFMQLFQHLDTQKTQSLCGVATAVTILNSLMINAPEDVWFVPYPYYTQEAFFSNCVSSEITLSTVMFSGMVSGAVVLKAAFYLLECLTGKVSVRRHCRS